MLIFLVVKKISIKIDNGGIAVAVKDDGCSRGTVIMGFQYLYIP
ncbi:6000_t:CDS:2 [Entrophospora sp. SA101]|nr:6000_t:CDS:2 [Entrophospora sp. SA101]